MSAIEYTERMLVNSVNALDELADEVPDRLKERAFEMRETVDSVLRVVQRWKDEAKRKRSE